MRVLIFSVAAAIAGALIPSTASAAPNRTSIRIEPMTSAIRVMCDPFSPFPDCPTPDWRDVVVSFTIRGCPDTSNSGSNFVGGTFVQDGITYAFDSPALSRGELECDGSTKSTAISIGGSGPLHPGCVLATVTLQTSDGTTYRATRRIHIPAA